jgi:phosphoribosylanthranilate isomerase
MTRLQDVTAAVAMGADALGWVFVSGSSRCVDVKTAKSLAARVPPFVSRVGLFVNPTLEEVRHAIDVMGLDTLQFHGEENPDICGQFRGRCRILKAFRVRGPETLAMLEAYRDVTDAWLLDAFVSGAHGGTGARFNWELAVQAVAMGHPIILAGGLTPENVAEAVRQVRPYALDVSSGVESAPGQKDEVKLRSFLSAAQLPPALR